MKLVAAVLLLVLGVLLSGCGSDDGIDYGGGHRKVKPDPQCGRGDSQLCDFEIELYCEYGAVSRAQLGGCLRNVTWGQFKYSDTNAARFARARSR